MQLSGSWLVLIDCSTFLSGVFYPKGKPRKILRLWQEEKFQLVVSEEIIKEYREKLEPVGRRMKKDSLSAEFYLDLVKTETFIVNPVRIETQACRDPSDLKYLEAAKAAEAGFLISSDKDLLVLTKFAKTRIITPDKFLEVFAKQKRSHGA